MTIEEIQTFLTVVEYGTVSKAAEQLFRSQSSISKRILQLESELGYLLITRAKGQRRIELTQNGEAFLPIAQQWLALWSDTQRLKLQQKNENLSIGSIDIVNNYLFVPLYQEILYEYPTIKLSLYTHHSSEIHGLLTNRTIDIGFVFSQVRYPDIISKPVCSEQMYLICRNNSPYHDDISPSQLSSNDEIFLRWGPDYQLWHDRFWDPSEPNMITVNTGSMIPHYLKDPKSWSIAPLSLIRYAQQSSSNLVFYSIKAPPPPRVCVQLIHRYPKESHKQTIAFFEERLKEYVNNQHNKGMMSLLL